MEPDNNRARRRWAVAALSLVLLVAGGWFSLRQRDQPSGGGNEPGRIVTTGQSSALTEHLETMRGAGH